MSVRQLPLLLGRPVIGNTEGGGLYRARAGSTSLEHSASLFHKRVPPQCQADLLRWKCSFCLHDRPASPFRGAVRASCCVAAPRSDCRERVRPPLSLGVAQPFGTDIAAVHPLPVGDGSGRVVWSGGLPRVSQVWEILRQKRAPTGSRSARVRSPRYWHHKSSLRAPATAGSSLPRFYPRPRGSVSR